MWLIAGCTSGDKVALSVELPPPIGEWTDGDDGLPPLEVSDQPVWSTGPDGADWVHDHVDFRGNRLITTGYAQVAAIDSATGATVWSADATTGIPGVPGAVIVGDGVVAGDDDSWMVLVPYTRGYCDDPAHECQPKDETTDDNETGVAALDQNGSLIWLTPVVPASPDAQGDATPELEMKMTRGGVGESMAVVSVAPQSFTSVQPQDVHSVAIDIADGTIMWDQPGQWAVGVSDQTVIAVESAAPSIGNPDTAMPPDSTVVGLSAEDGQLQWKVPGNSESYFVAMGGKQALIQVSSQDDPGSSSLAMVDAASGKVVTDLGTLTRGCATDGTDSVECLIEVGFGLNSYVYVVSVDRATGAVETSQNPIPENVIQMMYIEAVADGYAFVSDGSGAETQTYALDRTGEDPSGPFPGSFVAVSEKYLMLLTYDGSVDGSPTGNAVYERL